MQAQFAVSSIGEHRLGALLDRYGRESVEAAAEEIFRQSEQLDREAIRAIPDGVYAAEGFLDSAGVGDDPVRMKVKITVEGERLVFDLTETDGPGQGPINCGAVQTLSACRLAFKYLFNSRQPVNGGAFRPLEVITRPGSILHARSPAACQFYFTPLGLMIDLICSALAPALPGAVSPAVSPALIPTMQLHSAPAPMQRCAAGVGHSDARHLSWLGESMQEGFAGGVVLHTGPDTFELGDHILAAPISTSWA